MADAAMRAKLKLGLNPGVTPWPGLAVAKLWPEPRGLLNCAPIFREYRRAVYTGSVDQAGGQQHDAAPEMLRRGDFRAFSLWRLDATPPRHAHQASQRSAALEWSERCRRSRHKAGPRQVSPRDATNFSAQNFEQDPAQPRDLVFDEPTPIRN